MTKNLSVQSKVLTSLLLVFVMVVAGTASYSFFSEHALIHDVMLQRANDTAYAYFDGVNLTMLTGTTPQRGTLRDKLLNNPDVVDVRIVRGEPVSKVYGPGFDYENPRDELDHRALAGEPGELILNQNGERVLTVLRPMRASTSYHGTNCLTCHVVPEGTVLGAVRVTYSMRSLDQRIQGNMIKASLINISLFGIGIGMLAWLLHRLVFQRLSRMQAAMQRIERDSDLAYRLDIYAEDELGRVGGALNSMLERFSVSLKQVATTTHQLSQAASRIAGVAEQTAQGATEQRTQTDAMVTAINQMEATAQEVGRSAASTADASRGADSAARQGADLTGRAIDGIRQLVTELQRAEGVIGRLDERSRNVGSVLDVIKGIAEQTNLLALNAAIEAARAGDKGRGFAVVADEVRTLATRSHESTREIEHIIEQLQQEAHDAVSTMSGARESAEQRSAQIVSAATSLNEIVAQVTRISGLNTQMARAAAEQGKVTAEVNHNVLSISQIADHTARQAEQTAQVSEQLVGLCRRLEQMLSSFRL